MLLEHLEKVTEEMGKEMKKSFKKKVLVCRQEVLK